MKARTHCTVKDTKRDIRNTVLDVIHKDYDDKFVSNVAYQAMAVMFTVLIQEFGWGSKRLNHLKDSIEEEFALMEAGVFGRTFDNDDLIRTLKNKYDIDFKKSIFDSKGN